MKSFAFFAIVAVIIGSSLSFRLESLEENTSDDRIVGGATAKAGQFPYQASIRHPEVQTIIPPNKPLIFVHHCGGSIISDRLVVTTARCMQGLHGMTRYTEIVLGAHHIHKDGDHYQVSQIINHPAYNSNHDFKNDISLLQTNTSIQFNNRVKSIPLSMQFMDGGVRSTISGWGNVQTSGSDKNPTHLQFLHVTTLTNDKCRSSFNSEVRYQRYINDGTICTLAGQAQGACHRDIGNPLVANGKLIGLVAWGSPCARGLPDGFTRISSFVKWIREVSGVSAV